MLAVGRSVGLSVCACLHLWWCESSGMGNVNVAGNLEQFSDEVAGAFGELSRRLELEFNLGSSSASFSSPSTSREATRSRSEARAEGGPNLLTPNFCHALFLIADYLTVEECFRVLVLDQSIHSFLSSHAFTWKMLFRRLCLASGEDARYEAERVALAEKSLSPTGEVQYLQQRILHHFQDRLNYEHQHFQTLLNFDRVLYQYCATFKPTPRISTHGVFGMSSNLLKFRSRAIAECLSLCRKNAARVCVMETIMHPPTFKKSIPRGVLAGQASVSYLTLDMAQAQVCLLAEIFPIGYFGEPSLSYMRPSRNSQQSCTLLIMLGPNIWHRHRQRSNTLRRFASGSETAK